MPNTGGPNCTVDKGILTGIFISKRSKDIFIENDQTLLQSAIEDMIKADRSARLYPVFGADATPTQDEVIVETGTFADRSVRTKGGADILHFIRPSACQKRKLLTLNNQKVYAFYVYSSGYIEGIEVNGSASGIRPFPVYLRTELLKEMPDATEKLNVYVTKTQVDATNLSAGGITPETFSPAELEGVADVTLAVGTSAVGLITLTAKFCSGDNAEGLLAAGDWQISDAGGTPIVVAPVWNAATGQYEFADALFATANSYTFKIAPPAVQTSDLKFESVAPLTVSL